MFARLAFAVLVLALLSGLAATLALARTPVPTPTATVRVTSTASPPPIPTRPAAPEPLPAGCAPGASPSPLAPKAPSDLWVVMEANPNLPDLPPTVPVIRWTDNSADELCFAIERRVGDGPWQWQSAVQSDQRGAYGDGPVNGGPVCYRVSAGNDAARSGYSNEACLSPLPPSATPTPEPTPTPVSTVPGCSPYVLFSSLAPTGPSNMRIVAMGAVDGYWRYRLEWQDNSGDETCFGLEKRLSGGPWQWAGRTVAGTTEYIIDVNTSGRLC